MRKQLLPLLLLSFLLFFCCVSHLQEAKFYYRQGQNFSRLYEEEKALASFKRALKEAEEEARKKPSAQAFLMKGLVEIELENWQDASRSFRDAFAYGFTDGEGWAEQTALLGIALSFRELGLEEIALTGFEHLLANSRLKSLSLVAAQHYTAILLRRALSREEKEKKKILKVAYDRISKLSSRDFGCGFYHYLESQILSHLEDYRLSLEKAIAAKEFGLPSVKIARDNDEQIVFCYRTLKKALTLEEREKLEIDFQKWVERWGWRDAETPSWKKEAKNASSH